MKWNRYNKSNLFILNKHEGNTIHATRFNRIQSVRFYGTFILKIKDYSVWVSAFVVEKEIKMISKYSLIYHNCSNLGKLSFTIQYAKLKLILNYMFKIYFASFTACKDCIHENSWFMMMWQDISLLNIIVL